MTQKKKNDYSCRKDQVCLTSIDIQYIKSAKDVLQIYM